MPHISALTRRRVRFLINISVLALFVYGWLKFLRCDVLPIDISFFIVITSSILLYAACYQRVQFEHGVFDDSWPLAYIKPKRDEHWPEGVRHTLPDPRKMLRHRPYSEGMIAVYGFGIVLSEVGIGFAAAQLPQLPGFVLVISFASPVLCSGLLVLQAFWYDTPIIGVTVSLDDTGLEVKRRGQRAQRLAWSAMRRFMIVGLPGESQYVKYCVASDDRFLEFIIVDSTIIDQNDRMLMERDAESAANYRADAKALIATIAVRSGSPLLAVGLDILPGEVEDFPPKLLDQGGFASTAQGSEPILLPIARPYRLLWQRATRWMPITIIMSVVFLFSVYQPALPPVNRIFSTVLLLTIASIEPFLFISLSWSNEHPSIRADEHGITIPGTTRTRKPGVAWHDVTAWGVVERVVGGQAERRHYLWHDERGDRLEWVETDDLQLAGRGTPAERRAAFRARAARLHAAIARHTGLAPRDLSRRSGVASGTA